MEIDATFFFTFGYYDTIDTNKHKRKFISTQNYMVHKIRISDSPYCHKQSALKFKLEKIRRAKYHSINFDILQILNLVHYLQNSFNEMCLSVTHQ